MPVLSPQEFMSAKPSGVPVSPSATPVSTEMTPEQFMAAKPATAAKSAPASGALQQIEAGAVRGVAGIGSAISREVNRRYMHPIEALYAAAHLPGAPTDLPDIGKGIEEGAHKVGVETPAPHGLKQHVEQGVGGFAPFALAPEEGLADWGASALRTLVAGAASGAGAWIGRELGPYVGLSPATGETVGSIAGAFGPGAVEGAGKLGYRELGRELPGTKGLRAQQAASRLEASGVNPEELKANLERKLTPGATQESTVEAGRKLPLGPSGELVEGATPTTAGLVHSQPLAELTLARQSINPAPFEAAKRAGEAARTASVEGLSPTEASAETPGAVAQKGVDEVRANAERTVGAAQAAREKAWENAPPEEVSGQAGEAARDALAQHRQEAWQVRKALWDGLEQRNPTIPLNGLPGDSIRLRRAFERRGLRMPEFENFLGRLDGLGRTPLWSEVQGFSEQLNDAIDASKGEFGKWTTATKWLSDIKDTLLNALDQAAKSGAPNAEAAAVVSTPTQELFAEGAQPYLARTEAENAGLAGSGESARSRAAGASPSGVPEYGAAGAGAGQSGSAPGTEGISAPQARGPNWTESDAELYRRAKEAHARLKDVFDESRTLGKVLATKGPRGYELTAEQAAGKLFPADPALARQAALDYKAAGGDPEAYAQLASASLRKAASKDGALDLPAYERWLSNHSAGLSQFPGLEGRFANIERAQRTVDEAEAAKKAAIESYQKSHASLVLGRTWQDASKRIFSASTDPREVQSLVGMMSKDPEAYEGLKRMTADYITENYLRRLPSDEGVTRSAQVSALTKFVNQNREKLRMILGQQGLDSLGAVITDYQRNDLSELRGRIAGSQTARLAAQMAKSEAPTTYLGGLIRLVASKVGAIVLATKLGLPEGLLDFWVAKKGADWRGAAAQLLDDALVDPQKMRQLLQKLPQTQAARARFWRQMMRTTAGVAAQRSGRAAGGRVVDAWTPNDVEAAARDTDHYASGSQKKADNYKKGRFRFAYGPLSKLGEIAIETGKGRTRVAHDGSWKVPNMPAHYGHLTTTNGKDGDKADVFIGPDLSSRKVWVIDQVRPDGKFDETKSMLGFHSREAARSAYVRSFSDGKGSSRIGAMGEMSAEHFVELAKHHKLDKPVVPRKAGGGPTIGGFLTDPQSWEDMAQRAAAMVGSPLPTPAETNASLQWAEGSVMADPRLVQAYENKMVGLGGLGIFGGPAAKTADRAALDLAKGLEAVGEDASSIWKDTGWWHGPDGEWRFEIDDSTSKPGTHRQSAVSAPVGKLYQHSALYEAYPDLAAMPGRQAPPSAMNLASGYFQEPGEPGGWMRKAAPRGRVAVLEDPQDANELRSTWLHELQHAVQNQEGRSIGDLESIAAPGSGDRYQRSLAEVEARAAQARSAMSAAQRRATPPWESYDVPLKHILVPATKP